MCKPAPSTSTVLEKAEAIDNSKTTEYDDDEDEDEDNDDADYHDDDYHDNDDHISSSPKPSLISASPSSMIHHAAKLSSPAPHSSK